MAAKHENRYVIHANFNDVCALVKSRAFAARLNLELKSENQEGAGVWYRFHHGVSFVSWGEKITLTIIPINQNETSLIILSECGMPTQIIDWGKNKQNVCNIYEDIERNVHAFAGSAPMPTQGVRFCCYCGTKAEAGSNFCTNCGKKLQ